MPTVGLKALREATRWEKRRRIQSRWYSLACRTASGAPAPPPLPLGHWLPIPAAEFIRVADRKSIQLLLETWQAAACQDDEEYKELKAQLVGLGCRPRLLARLESMPASEFYAAVDSHSLDLLLAKWQREALKVS